MPWWLLFVVRDWKLGGDLPVYIILYVEVYESTWMYYFEFTEWAKNDRFKKLELT